MADSQIKPEVYDPEKVIKGLLMVGVIKHEDLSAAQSLAKEIPVGGAMIAEGAADLSKTPVAEVLTEEEKAQLLKKVVRNQAARGAFLKTLGGAIGAGDVLAADSGVGLVVAAGDVAMKYVGAENAALDESAAAQKNAEEALHASVEDTRAIGITRADEAVKEYDLGLEPEGSQGNSTPGKAGPASGIGNLKTAADQAIRDAFDKEGADTILTRALVSAKSLTSLMDDARDESEARLKDAEAMPDITTAVDFPGDLPGMERNVEKFVKLEQAQADLKQANQDLLQNQELIAALQKKLDQSTGETAKARIQMNAAKQAVQAALKNATGPAPTSGPTPPPNPPPSAGDNQALRALLEAANQKVEDQARKIQSMDARQTEFQAELDQLNAKLANLQSCGLR